jgi:hypothetical protein
MGDPVTITANGVINKITTNTAFTAIGVFMGVRYTDPNTKQPTYKQFYPAAGLTSPVDDIFAYVVDNPLEVFQAQCDGQLAYTALGRNVNINSTFNITAATSATAGGSQGSGNFLNVSASANGYSVLTQGIFPGMTITGAGFTATTVVSVTATAIQFAGAAQNLTSQTFTLQGVNSSGVSMLSLNAASVATTSTLPIRILDFVNGPFSNPPIPTAVGDAFTDVYCTWNFGSHTYQVATGI